MFRLALQFKQVNPYAMARRMPARLLRDWELYFELEPPDGTRADVYAAQITAMLYNLNRDAKKDPGGKPLGEFLLDFGAEPVSDEERQQQVDNKMRVAALIMKAQAEAAAESRQPPATVHEHGYPAANMPMPVPEAPVADDREQRLLEAARAAMKRTE